MDMELCDRCECEECREENNGCSGFVYCEADIAKKQKEIDSLRKVLEKISKLDAYKDGGHHCDSKLKLQAAKDMAEAALKKK